MIRLTSNYDLSFTQNGRLPLRLTDGKRAVPITFIRENDGKWYLHSSYLEALIMLMPVKKLQALFVEYCINAQLAPGVIRFSNEQAIQ